MSSLWSDVRYGARMLVKNLGVTATAVLTLGLGICANSTIFSWINATVLDPIPGVRDTRDFVTFQVGPRSENPVPPLSDLDFQDLRHGLRGHAFSDLLAYNDDWLTLTDHDKPERRYGAVVTPNYFTLLGVSMTAGRGFGAAEAAAGPGGAPVVVISDALWRTRYGAKKVVGQVMFVNRRPYTIVGVAPAAFQGCKSGMRVELWIPMAMDTEVWGGRRIGQRDRKFLNVLGRMAPGVSMREAEVAADAVMRRVAAEFPVDSRGPVAVTLDPLWRSPFGANVYLAASLPFMLGVAGVVLLLACANVANLMLVRSVSRRREYAVRLAMGAARWRLVRQSLVESALLALIGAGVALIATGWTADLLQSFMPPFSNPVTLPGRVDGTVILLTVLVAVASSLVAGILPALRATRLAPVEVLNDESGRGTGSIHKARLTRALVVAQVALSLLLLVFAGLFVRSLDKARRADPGFDANGVLLVSFDLDSSGLNRQAGTQFQRDLLARLRNSPGVMDVALADWVPLTFSTRSQPCEVEGYTPRRDESMDIRRAVVSPDYFRTLHIPLVAGREFSAMDTIDTEPVALVDETFAARYWPGQVAVGKRIRAGGTWRTIVGVARATRHVRVKETPDPMFYLSAFQDYRDEMVVHARLSGDPAAFAATVRTTVRAMSPGTPVFDVMTLAEAMRMATIFERVGGTFVGAFGAIALLLAAVGIFGVLSYTTRQRTRELGIRMALGADRSEVFRFVLAEGARLVVMGLVLGLAAALALTRLARGRLYGITETDAVSYAAVAGLLSLVALTACAIPAWRAAKSEPLHALRAE